MGLSIIASGDIILSGPIRTQTGKGTVFDHLRTSDSSFVNLEMPLTKAQHPAEKLIALKGDPEYANALKDWGVGVATVANNHGMDFGWDGLKDTFEVLDQVGIPHAGGGKDVAESFAPVVLNVKGTKVAYIGVTTTLPNGSGAGPNRPGVAGVRVFSRFVIDTVTIDETPGMSPFVETITYAEDEKILVQAIKDAHEKADLVLVAIHWGVPYGWSALSQDEIATYQQPLAHAMIDAGASAIFGHHPHVVHGVEIYKSVPIFYSLGNFVLHTPALDALATIRSYPPYKWSSLQSRLSNIGALAKVSWDANGSSSVHLIPVSLDSYGEPSDASPSDVELLLERLTLLSKGRGVKFELQKAGLGHAIVVTQG